MNSKNNNCAVCGRELTDPLSVEVGIGPFCRANLKTDQANDPTLNLFASRSEFEYTIDGPVIMIRDLGGPKSATNDMGLILSDITRDEQIDLNHYRIMYLDSMRIWDGVLANPTRFFSLNERDPVRARQKLMNRKLKTA
jgi:hypothetical protein